MNPNNLKALATEEVLERLSRGLEKQAEAWEMPRQHIGGLGQKRFDDLIEAPHRELLSRGAEGSEALRALLRHPKAGVRMWAATQVYYCGMDQDKDEADRVIYELASEKGHVGAWAQHWLDGDTEPEWVDRDY